MLLREIINSIESVAPRSAQEEWDNSGMQVGDTGRDIQSVLLTTDVTSEVVDEAIEHGCQLIISHHPLLFRPLKQVCGQTPQARIVEQAIKHDIAIYSAHTSLDSVSGGINTRLADILGIRDLDEPMPFDSLLKRVRERLNTTYIRYTMHNSQCTIHNAQCTIEKVALCGGSGAEFIEEAIHQGADAYLTADCKYHDFQAAEGRIALIDIDHWISERHARDIFRDILAPLGVTCFISQKDKTPILIANI